MHPFVRITILLLLFPLAGNTLSQVANGKIFDVENLVDENGYRQGYWRLRAQVNPGDRTSREYVFEEGNYVDNRREGIWKCFFPTGTIKGQITYFDNKPHGQYKTFYENGKVEEEGYWKINKNTGSFARYYESGLPANIFTFNEKGKRSGLQSYYYPNGKLQMTAEIDNGVAHGELKMYDTSGKLIEEKRITNGEVEESSVKKYVPEGQSIIQAMPELSKIETSPAVDVPNVGQFISTGKNTLYNRNRQVSQAGDFKDGRLWNGKWFRYDENGLLKQVEVYKEGRFIGYGLIDEANK